MSYTIKPTTNECVAYITLMHLIGKEEVKQNKVPLPNNHLKKSEHKFKADHPIACHPKVDNVSKKIFQPKKTAKMPSFIPKAESSEKKVRVLYEKRRIHLKEEKKIPRKGRQNTFYEFDFEKSSEYLKIQKEKAGSIVHYIFDDEDEPTLMLFLPDDEMDKAERRIIPEDKVTQAEGNFWKSHSVRHKRRLKKFSPKPTDQKRSFNQTFKERSKLRKEERLIKESIFNIHD